MPAFYNQATLTYNGTSTQSNTTVGELVATLTITKNNVNQTYTPGERITYVVNLVNSGATAMTGITLTDDLGAYTFGADTRTPLTYVPNTLLYYVNGVLQTTPTVTAGPPLTVTGLAVPAGGNITVVYQADVNGYATPTAGATVTNTATVTGTGITTPLTATSTTTVNDAPRLTVTKSLSPTTVAENGQLTYTFTIQNYGNTETLATDTTTLTDTFNPILNPITVTYNGAAWATSNYTYDTATGVFTTTPGAITVPAATATQNETTGIWTVTPGTTILTVSGTV